MSKDGIYVCAELGVNWNGDFKILKDEVLEMKMAGVDAVKLQLFDKDALQAYEPTLRGRLENMVLDAPDVLEISERVHACELELVVTPMYIEAFDWLKDMPIDGIKIRAKDWLRDDFYEASRKFDVPVYTSIPCVAGEMVQATPTQFARTRGKERYRIYCVPLYPPEKSDLNLWKVVDFDGCSLHSRDWWDHFAAACINIQYQYYHNLRRRFYVEAHYLAQALPRECQPDADVSVDWKGMKDLARACEEFEEAIG